jgi:hypothetical protein
MSREDQQLVLIERDEGSVSCRSPYHPAFIARAKEIRGRFVGGVWFFPLDKEEEVRAICREVYGTDGSPGGVLVSVQVQLDKMRLVGRPDFFLAGRCIAYRPERDSRVRLGPRVSIIKGGFPPSGGSVERPRLMPLADTVVEVRDLPREAAEAAAAEHPSLVRIFGGAGTANPVDPLLLALENERDKLKQLLDDLEQQIADRRASTTLPAF